MRKLILGLAVACLAATAEAQPIGYNWSGFYLGGHLGYGDGGDALGRPSDGTVRRGRSVRYAVDHYAGFLGGAQAGYNWHLTSGWLVGVEADVSAAGISGFQNERVGGSGRDWGTKLALLTTARARFGYAFSNLLIYGAAGFAGSVSKAYEKIIFSGVPEQPGEWNSQFRPGWTISGGVEWGFASGWSARGEYLFVRLESGGGFTPGHADLHALKLGVNYRFGAAASLTR